MIEIEKKIRREEITVFIMKHKIFGHSIYNVAF